MSDSYEEALAEAKTALEDVKERGEAALGPSWEEVRKELYSPEEIAESDLRVAMMGILIQARNEGISIRRVREIGKEIFDEAQAMEVAHA